MARPHPVVGVAAELADGRRRSAHQADIAEHPEYEKIILVAVEEGFHIGPKALRGVRGFPDKTVGIDLDDRIALRFRHPGLIALEDQVRHFVHMVQETDGQALVRQLLLAVHRPETIFQVIVVHTAVTLDIAVTTVMVRQEKALVRDQFTGTSTAEQDDSILE